MPSLLPILCAIAATLSPGYQEVDISRLMADIRAAVVAQMPNLSFHRGGELAGPASKGDFVFTWTDDDEGRLHVSCNQYSSAEEAIRRLRELRMMISGGRPAPLPGVGDEAYYLSAYGWHTYFARRQFVCQVSGRTQAPTRSLTEIIVKHIGSSVPEKRN